MNKKLQGGSKENKAVECSGPTIPCPETEFRYWVTRGEMDGLRKDGEGIQKSEEVFKNERRAGRNRDEGGADNWASFASVSVSVLY